MPTFNSARTIEQTLQSIRNQNYPQDKIKILLIDGGSTDSTIKIGDKYAAHKIDNPKIQQEYGKFIGLNSTDDEVIIFLDSDEVFCSKDAIYKRVLLLAQNNNVGMVLTGGYKYTKGTNPINNYINSFSDPFAYFMNRISSESSLFESQMARRYSGIPLNDLGTELNFNKSDVLPNVDLCAGIALSGRVFISPNGLNREDISLIPKMFHSVVENKFRIVIVKDDGIFHNSSDTLKNYLNKLRWRITMNVHYKNQPGTGFANREKLQPIPFRLKKYLFPIYTITLLGPIIDSMVMFKRTGYWINLIHLPLCIFVTFHILLQVFSNAIGFKPRVLTYGSNARQLDLD